MTTQDKRQPAFEDTDTIWFGKYRDECIKDVPANYLLWWFDQNQQYQTNKQNLTGYMLNNQKLYNYIFNAMDALKIEGGRE